MSHGVIIKDAVKRYGDFTALKGVNLEIKQGEFFTLLGPSGCGKTTLLRMIAGFNSVDGGEICFDDKVINNLEAHKRDIGMVFQNYAIFPHLTVAENVAYGLKAKKYPKDQIPGKVEEALDLVQIKNLKDRKPNELSGGQQQRVALARAFVIEPGVLLMDEPLSNLDAKLRGQMRVEISKLHQRLETTIIYVTHDQTEAMTLGTRIVVMKDGIIQQVDNPQNLYDKPCNKFVAGFIGAPQMNMIDATVGKDGALTTLSFGGRTVALSEAKSKKLEDAGYIGKVVTLGIRPEDLHDEESYLAMSPKSVFEATVRVYEMLGSEVLLYFDIEDASFVAKVNPRTTARPGDTIKLAMDLEKIHIFDKDTELVVLN